MSRRTHYLRRGNSFGKRIRWCRGAELNCRHYDFQSYALPTELPRHTGGTDVRTVNIPCASARNNHAECDSERHSDHHVERVMHADVDARARDQRGEHEPRPAPPEARERRSWHAGVVGFIAALPICPLLSTTFSPHGPLPYSVDWALSIFCALVLGVPVGVLVFRGKR